MPDMLVREALIGRPGKIIRDGLLELIAKLDASTMATIRNDEKSYDQARYAAGVSDGVRLALNSIMELGKP